MDLAGGDQLGDHGRNAARAMEFLAQEFARRLHVHQQRDLMADALPSSTLKDTPTRRAMALR